VVHQRRSQRMHCVMQVFGWRLARYCAHFVN
jgi:hypothetical protein